MCWACDYWLTRWRPGTHSWLKHFQQPTIPGRLRRTTVFTHGHGNRVMTDLVTKFGICDYNKLHAFWWDQHCGYVPQLFVDDFDNLNLPQSLKDRNTEIPLCMDPKVGKRIILMLSYHPRRLDPVLLVNRNDLATLEQVLEEWDEAQELKIQMAGLTFPNSSKFKGFKIDATLLRTYPGQKRLMNKQNTWLESLREKRGTTPALRIGLCDDGKSPTAISYRRGSL